MSFTSKDVSLYICVPAIVGDKKKIYALLDQYPNGTAHPFHSADTTQCLCVKTSNGIVVINISSIPKEHFLSNVDMNAAEIRLAEDFKIFPSLGDYMTMTINRKGAGVFITELPDGKNVPALFTTTNKGNAQYVDLVVHLVVDGVLRTVTYNVKSVCGMNHSGDITKKSVTGFTKLLHYLTIEGCHKMFAVGVVGYRQTQLRTCAEQVPMVCIVDNEAVYMVHCPMDRATIGDTTYVGLLVGQVIDTPDGKKVQYAILPCPITCQTPVDTGDVPDELKAHVEGAFRTATQMFTEYDNQQATEEKALVTESTVSTESTEPDELQEEETGRSQCGNTFADLKFLVFQQQGIPVDNSPSNELLQITSGTGIHVGPDAPEEKPLVLLPPWKAQGSPALALGTSPTGLPISPDNLFNLMETLPAVYHVADGWKDSVAVCHTYKLNGMFIVHVDEDNKINMADRREREKFMNTVSTGAIVALAGGCAITLFKIGPYYYFFRGVRWPGLLDTMPKFADNVTQLINPEIFMEWVVNQGGVLNFPLFTEPGHVFHDGKKVNPSDVFYAASRMSLDEFEVKTPSLVDLITQLCVGKSPQELQKIVTTAIPLLERIRDKVLSSVRQELADAIEQKNQKRQDEVIKGIKAKKKRVNRLLRPVLETLSNATSLKYSTSRQTDLHRLKRRTAITNNVKNALEMDPSDFIERIEDKSPNFAYIQLLDPNSHVSCLSENFLQFCEEEKNLGLPSPTPTLDGTTTWCLVEQLKVSNAERIETGRELAPLCSSSQHTLAMVAGHSGYNRFVSSMIFPLFQKFTDCMDPSELQWIDECNDVNISAFRILTAHTISAASCTREFNIKPSQQSVAWFQAKVIIDGMRGLVNGTTVPSAEDRNNTNCQIMRGLYCYVLTVLASRTTPLSMAWQLVMKNPDIQVPKQDEWWMYIALIELFPYTCWDPTLLHENIKKLIAKCFRATTNKVTNLLRNRVSEEKKTTNKRSVERRDAELKWLDLAIRIIFSRLTRDRENSVDNKNIATRLLEFLPEHDSRSNGFNSIVGFFKILEDGKVDWEKPFQGTLQIALNILTKRSNVFRPVKETLLEALKEGKSTDDALADLGTLKNQLRDQADIKIGVGVVVRVQNETTNLGRVWSDAELYRPTWSVLNGHDETKQASTLAYIVEGHSQTVRSEDEKDDAEPEEVKEYDVVKFVQGYNQPEVINFARSLKTIQMNTLVTYNSIPTHRFVQLMSYIGVEDEVRIVEMSKAIVETYITGFQDYTKANADVLKLLN